MFFLGYCNISNLLDFKDKPYNTFIPFLQKFKYLSKITICIIFTSIRNTVDRIPRFIMDFITNATL